MANDPVNDREFHRARAMLLGMKYRPASHSYVKLAYRPNGVGAAMHRIDADTLEPVDTTEAFRRSALYEAGVTRQGNRGTER